MARKIIPLTLAQIRNAKPKEKLYKLSDGGGLALWIYPSGRKTWRFEFRRVDKKLDTLTLGSVDDFALSEARTWRDSNRAHGAIAIGHSWRAVKTLKPQKQASIHLKKFLIYGTSGGIQP